MRTGRLLLPIADDALGSCDDGRRPQQRAATTYH